MTRLKTTALTALGLTILLASFGVFAAIGLAALGVFATLAAIGFLTASAATLFSAKQNTIQG